MIKNFNSKEIIKYNLAMAINDKKLAKLGMEVFTDTFQCKVHPDKLAKAGMKLISDALQPEIQSENQSEIQEQWWFKDPWVTLIVVDDPQKKKKKLQYIDERTGIKYNNPKNIPRPCWMN